MTLFIYSIQYIYKSFTKQLFFPFFVFFATPLFTTMVLNIGFGVLIGSESWMCTKMAHPRSSDSPLHDSLLENGNSLVDYIDRKATPSKSSSRNAILAAFIAGWFNNEILIFKKFEIYLFLYHKDQKCFIIIFIFQKFSFFFLVVECRYWFIYFWLLSWFHISHFNLNDDWEA